MVALYDEVLEQLREFDGACCTPDLLQALSPEGITERERERLRSRIWIALKELQKNGIVDAGPLRSKAEGRVWFVVDWDDDESEAKGVTNGVVALDK